MKTTKKGSSNTPSTGDLRETKRMSASTFVYLCEKFSKDDFCVVSIKANKFEIFKSQRRRRKKDNKRFGPKIGPILDWLDENVSEPYYPRARAGDLNNRRFNDDVDFYFMNQQDAVAFKLMFLDEDD